MLDPEKLYPLTCRNCYGGVYFIVLCDVTVVVFCLNFSLWSLSMLPYLKNEFEGDLEWNASVFETSWILKMSSH